MPSPGARSFIARAESLLPFLYLLALSAWVLLTWATRTYRNFDGDQAVMGLMGSHVLRGEFSPYFWGQNYLGSAFAVLMAPSLALLGRGSILAMRLPSVGVFLLYESFFALLVARLWGRRVALLALALMAVPSFYVLRYGVVFDFSRYELIGTLCFLLVFGAEPRTRARRLLRCALLGLLIGIGLWLMPIFLLHALLALGVLLLRSPEWRVLRARLARHNKLLPPALLLAAGALACAVAIQEAPPLGGFLALALLLAGIMVGGVALLNASAPGRDLPTSWLAGLAGYVLGNSVQIAARFSGQPPDTQMLFHVPTLAAIRDTMEHQLPSLWGITGVHGTFDALFPFWTILLVWACLLFFCWMQRRALARILTLAPLDRDDARVLVPAGMLALNVVLLWMRHPADAESVRYLLPSWSATMLMVAVALSFLVDRMPIAGYAGLLVLFSSLVAGNLPLLQGQEHPPYAFAPAGIAELRQVLAQQGIRGGYAGYWTAYPLDYLTEEHLIFSPDSGMVRYAPYARAVESFPRFAVLLPAGAAPSAPSDAPALARIIAQDWRQDDAALWRIAWSRVLSRRRAGSWDVWLLSDPASAPVAHL